MQKEMPYFLNSENDKLFEFKKPKTKQKLSTSCLFRINIIKTQQQ